MLVYFLYSWQKIFMNKNMVSNHNLCVLFISFFSKMYNKKKLLPCGPLNGCFLFWLGSKWIVCECIQFNALDWLVWQKNLTPGEVSCLLRRSCKPVFFLSVILSTTREIKYLPETNNFPPLAWGLEYSQHLPLGVS